MSKRSEGSDVYLQCVGLTRLISTWKIPWYCSLFYMSIFVLLSFTQYSLHWIIKNNSLRSSQMYYNHNQKIHTVVGNTETNRLEEITETLNPDPAAGLLSMMSLYTLDCYIDQILQCILRFLHNLQPTTLSDRWQYVKKKIIMLWGHLESTCYCKLMQSFFDWSPLLVLSWWGSIPEWLHP